MKCGAQRAPPPRAPKVQRVRRSKTPRMLSHLHLLSGICGLGSDVDSEVLNRLDVDEVQMILFDDICNLDQLLFGFVKMNLGDELNMIIDKSENVGEEP